MFYLLLLFISATVPQSTSAVPGMCSLTLSTLYYLHCTNYSLLKGDPHYAHIHFLGQKLSTFTDAPQNPQKTVFRDFWAPAGTPKWPKLSKKAVPTCPWLRPKNKTPFCVDFGSGLSSRIELPCKREHVFKEIAPSRKSSQTVPFCHPFWCFWAQKSLKSRFWDNPKNNYKLGIPSFAKSMKTTPK